MYVYVCGLAGMGVCMYLCMHVCACICMYVGMYVCMCASQFRPISLFGETAVRDAAAHGDAVYANVMRPLAANKVRRRRERLSSGSQGTTTRSFIDGVVGDWCCGLCQWPATGAIIGSRFTLAAVLPKAPCSRFRKLLFAICCLVRRWCTLGAAGVLSFC